MSQLRYTVEHISSLSKATGYDSIVLVGDNLDDHAYPGFVKPYLEVIKENIENDKSIKSEANAFYVKNEPITLIVFSPTGPLIRDYDDVRRYEDATKKGMKRILKAGKKSPLLIVSSNQTDIKKYKDAAFVSLLAAFEVAYVPIEVREDVPEKSVKITKLGISTNQIKSTEQGKQMVNDATGIEFGRVIARDIGGSDPERMSAVNTEKYLKDIFKDSNIKIDVTSGQDKFVKDYPLFAAVNRCASTINRHDGRIIYMEYTGEAVKHTYMFVGKGVTYDTGGADVKAGGHMAGMHRDKCGAATVAGLFGVLEKLKPKHVKVVGRLAMVRNSIGTNCYVADEIITSAAGVRVRVGNTDAEGRMAMTDPLFHMKEQALNEVNPHLFTIATLTGHAIRAVGEAYTIVLDNGPALETEFAQKIQKLGDTLSNPFEISTVRREDYDFIAGRNEYEDVIQCNNLPSSGTARGHQFPAAFMITSSGLDKHGIDSDKPVKYSHMDIAGSSGPYPGIPTGTPIVALAKMMHAF